MPKADNSQRRNAQLIDQRLLWLLTPAAAAACTGFCLFFLHHWNWPRAMVCGGFGVATVCFGFALWDQRRYWWATRALAGMVSLTFFGAVARLSWFPTPGAPGPHLPLLFLATVGFMVCGVPALSFMLWGHTRGKSARADAQHVTGMDRWTTRLIPLLGYATWFAVGVYLVSLLEP